MQQAACLAQSCQQLQGVVGEIKNVAQNNATLNARLSATEQRVASFEKQLDKEAVSSVSNIHLEWGIPRKKKLDEHYGLQCQSMLKRFSRICPQRKCKEINIAHVTRSVAHLFWDAESKHAVKDKTWNDILKLLRTIFKHLHPIGAINPFSNVPTKETEINFRKPFSP